MGRGVSWCVVRWWYVVVSGRSVSNGGGEWSWGVVLGREGEGEGEEDEGESEGTGAEAPSWP